ncbi:hypothetical protein BG842_02080 [Haladaptatus sp. W1]|uniref:glycerol dehydrogenase n=1 Tax=Haladaptatus sp. W1 TaxID=1897478 RepID=UPI000849C1DF|nr:glycerol dehydrogenase [Haladaptatus sp. W1]ODR80362.1 hypothetical protein BG842_02080 [Haladaptatus sp. W1]
MHREFASPARYIQGSGVLERVGQLTLQHGESALIISDSDVWQVVGEMVEKSFNGVDAAMERANFTGECSTIEIDRLTDIARKRGADVIIGIGGGKAIDTAKAVCARTGAVIGSVPTIASTDAPTSSLSIIYEEDGTFEKAHRHDFHPSFVIVDTKIIARAPTRWFISGIGDALATWFEAKATWESGGTTIYGTRPTYVSKAIARHSYDLLREDAEDAVHAVSEDTVTESVEAVTEATILLSGLGFENGGTAAAHAVHDGLTMLSGTSNATHGEKVTVGVLVQLILEEYPDEEIKDIIAFADRVGLPVSLMDIDSSDPTRQELLRVGHVACDSDGSMGNEAVDVTPEDVADALQTLDSISKSE